MTFSLFLALKYLKPKRTFASIVTVISILGVVLGVAIVIIVRAVMTGFGDMWRDKILAFKPHLMVVSYNGIIEDPDDLAAKIKRISDVESATSSIEVRVMVEHERSIQAPLVVGIEPEDAAAIHPELASCIVAGDFNLEGDNVLIGVDLASTLGVGVGGSLLVYSPLNLITRDEVHFPEELVVAGIYEMGQGNFDMGFVITSLGVARDLVGITSGAYAIQVKVAEPDNPRRLAETLDSVRNAIGGGYAVRTWHDVDRDLFAALAVEKNMMVILMMFITVVAIFSVTNTLIVITARKMHEIGLLKALGFSSSQVLLTFVIHGWIQCLVGTALGIGAAYGILHNMQRIVAGLGRLGVQVFPKSVYGLNEIPWRVYPLEVAQVAAMVIVFCTLASFLPAWRAARMNPVDALRG